MRPQFHHFLVGEIILHHYLKKQGMLPLARKWFIWWDPLPDLPSIEGAVPDLVAPSIPFVVIVEVVSYTKDCNLYLEHSGNSWRSNSWPPVRV